LYYKGNFTKNKKQGYGIEKGKDYIFEGNFENDKKEGIGKIEYLNSKEIYKGIFTNNFLTGKGEYAWANGDSYYGEFLDGKMHGTGEYKWADGGKYIGEYTNNIKEGKGKFFWTNGRIYEGEFDKGKPHGKGVVTQSEKVYQVEFENGKLISRAFLRDSTQKENELNKYQLEKAITD